MDEYDRRDYQAALRLARPLANAGNPRAQYVMGLLHHFGRAVPQDHAEAARWYRLSAAQGNHFAQNNLGALYEQGLGVERNLNEARRLYAASRSSNEPIIMQNIERVERQRDLQLLEQQRRREESRAILVREENERDLQNARNLFSSYTSRQKTLLEQILNYTSFGLEDGKIGNNFDPGSQIWISGYDGSHRCVMTNFSLVPNPSRQIFDEFGRRGMRFMSFERLLTIDLRELNERGFRISSQRVGDERQSIPVADNAVMERLQRAWGLAFQECPGRRSRF